MSTHARVSPLVEATGFRRRLGRLSGSMERLVWVFAAAAMAVLLVWIWFPIVDLALMSINTEPFRGIPNGNVTLEWYRTLFSTHDAASSLTTSAELGLVVAGIVAVGAFATARAFQKVRHKAAFLLFVIVPLVIPGLIFGFGILVYSDLVHESPGWLTLIVAHLSWSFPFGFLVMLIATSRLDTRLLEAAADLGASRWQVLRDIELPLLRPGIVSAFLFGFLLSFNELVRTIFVNGSVTTLPVFVWAQDSSHSSTVPVTYALTSLIMVASLLVIAAAYWLLFRGGQRARLGKNV